MTFEMKAENENLYQCKLSNKSRNEQKNTDKKPSVYSGSRIDSNLQYRVFQTKPLGHANPYGFFNNLKSFPPQVRVIDLTLPKMYMLLFSILTLKLFVDID